MGLSGLITYTLTVIATMGLILSIYGGNSKQGRLLTHGGVIMF